MSNFPENEKLTESAEISADLEIEMEDSTVFSDPTANKVTAENVKRRKLLPKIIASVLIPAILAGTVFAAIKFIPELEKETEVVSGLDEIKVIDLDAEKFTNAKITNANGNFEFYCKKVITESDEPLTQDSTEEDKYDVTITWFQKGMDENLTSSEIITSTINSLAKITSVKEVVGKPASECGFDTPAATVEFTDEDGNVTAFQLGSESPDRTGYYLKRADEKIFVVSSEINVLLSFRPIDLASIALMPAFPRTNLGSKYVDDLGNLLSFDTITISGKNFSQPVVFAPNTDELTSTYAEYYMNSPVRRPASEKVDALVDMFKTGASPDAAYSFDCSAASLKEVGLDKPDLVATMKIGNTTLTYKFRKMDDTNCAVICDGWPLIQRVPLSTVPFVDYTESDYKSSWIALNALADLEEFTFKTPEKTHVFGVDVEIDPEDDSIKNYTITYDGKELDTAKFQEFYEACVGMLAADYVVNDDVTGSADYALIYTFNDTIGGKNAIEFHKDGASRYQIRNDGVPMGRVNSSALKKLANKLNEMLLDKDK